MARRKNENLRALTEHDRERLSYVRGHVLETQRRWEASRQHQSQVIKELYADGVRLADLAAAAELSRQRIHQVLHDNKPVHPKDPQ